MADHSEQAAIDMEIRCANNAISHGEACARFARNVIADSRQHFVQKIRQRPKNWNGEDVAVANFNLALAVYRTCITPDTGPFEMAIHETLGRPVFEIEIGQAGEIDPLNGDVCAITLVFSGEGNIGTSPDGAQEDRAV